MERREHILFVVHLEILPQVVRVDVIAVNDKGQGGNVRVQVVDVPFTQGAGLSVERYLRPST